MNRAVTVWSPILSIGLVTAALGVSVATESKAPVTANGGAISGVVVVSDTTLQATTSDDWIDLAGATASISIPSNWPAGLVMARFSAIAGMTNGGDRTDSGQVRILLDGQEMNPAGGTTANFVGFTDSLEAHAIDRWLSTGPGTHTLQVQWQMCTCTTTEFEITDWTLTVEKAKSH